MFYSGIICNFMQICVYNAAIVFIMLRNFMLYDIISLPRLYELIIAENFRVFNFYCLICLQNHCEFKWRGI